METVVTGLNRPADRAARVVDQEVHTAVVRNELLHKTVAIGHIGNICRVGNEAVAFGLGFLAGLVQLVHVTSADDGDGTCLRKLMGSSQTNAGRAAGDQYHFASHGATQRAVNVQIWVQVAFPIVPQAPGVVFEIGAGHARALECGERVAAIKTGGVIHKAQHVFRQTQVFHDGVAHPAHRC